MRRLIDVLHQQNCSLVLRDSSGAIHTYYKKGVRDLEHLLDHEPQTLCGADIADKVIGKAAAGLIAMGGVSRLYADVLSRKALPLLEAAGIDYAWGTMTDQIVIAEGDDRCPLEQIVAPATTAEEAVTMLRAHFKAMQNSKTHLYTNT